MQAMDLHDNALTVEIHAQSNGPDAVGRTADGETVFVPYALPGEQVRVRVAERKKRLVWATLDEVLSPAAGRVEPRCTHYGVCGGCHLQHASYATQLAIKRDIVIDQLQRVGGFAAPPVADTLPAASPWHYRNHIQLAQHDDGRLGFRALRSDTVVPLDECPISNPALVSTLHQLAFEPLGNVERFALRTGDSGDVMLALQTTDGILPEFEIGTPLSIVSLGPDGEQIVVAGDDHLQISVRGRAFRVSAGSFFQVNTEQAGKLVEQVLAALDLHADDIVFDLYCGVGLFSAFIAPAVRELAGFELEGSAVDDAVLNLDTFDNVSLYAGPVEDSLPAIAQRPDKVVLDPPRAGAGKAVVAELLRLQPARIVYVSCEPVTLARDARQLVDGGYSLLSVQPVDMFPQTHHIETVSVFAWG